MNNTDLTPSLLFSNIKLLKLVIGLRFVEKKNVPVYQGSAWRGLIGWEMKKLVCPFNRHAQCKQCTINKQCPYFLLFEDNSTIPGLRESPRGYIFYPPISTDPVQELHVTLIGSCAKILPVLIKAIAKGEKTGIGDSRSRYQLLSVEQVLPNNSRKHIPLDFKDFLINVIPQKISQYIETEQIKKGMTKADFLTPVRLRKKGRYLNPVEWPFFFETLVKRLEALNCMFNNGNLLGKDLWLQLKESFTNTTYGNEHLRWKDFSRYSNRQRKKIPMGGMIGTVSLTNTSSHIYKWWQAAELVHIGKGAAMGLGKITLH